MPLTDLLGKRARTASGVEVATPTVRSFFRALEVFGAEIGIVRSAAREAPNGLSLDIALSPFIIDLKDGRLEYVLEGLAPFGEQGPGPIAVAAATMVAPLAPRIDALLGVPGSESSDEDTEDVESGVLLVLGCAERFHIDPMAVMDWPLGLFLDSIKAFSRPAPAQDDKEAPEMVGSMFPAQEFPEVIGGPTRSEP